MDRAAESILTVDGIDPVRMIQQARTLLAPLRTTDRFRRMINVVLEHMTAENVDRDIERTMATMVAEPRHEYFGCPGLETVPLVGYEAVRNYYLGTFALEPGRAGMDLIRVGIGNDGCFKEGTAMYTGPGAMAKFPELAQHIDPGRPCVVRKRHLVVMAFEGDRIASELHYVDGPFTLDDVQYVD